MEYRILYIILAILVLVVMFGSLRRYLTKMGYKDFNKHILDIKGKHEKRHFLDESTGNAYMIDTDTGELYFCTKLKTHVNIQKMRDEHKRYVENCDPNTFKKICDNYYDIIDKDIHYNIVDLLPKK